MVLILVIISIFLISGCSLRENKVGILNMEKVIQESRRAAQLKSELSQTGSSLKKEYEKTAAAGESQPQKLNQVYQQFLKNRESLQGQLKKEVKQVLSELAQKKNLDVVLRARYTQFGGLDITPETISLLDKKFYQGEK